MPLFDLAQRQNAGWLPTAAMNYIAEMIGVTRMRAYEVATFYSMFNLSPIGKFLVRVCTTTPCELRGSNHVFEACRHVLGINLNETTADGMFTLREVECLGACVNAPIIAALRKGETPSPGSQSGRQTSAPTGGATTLKEQTV